MARRSCHCILTPAVQSDCGAARNQPRRSGVVFAVSFQVGFAKMPDADVSATDHTLKPSGGLPPADWQAFGLTLQQVEELPAALCLHRDVTWPGAC